MAFAHMKTQWFSGGFFVAHVKTQAELAISGRWPSNGYSRQYHFPASAWNGSVTRSSSLAQK